MRLHGRSQIIKRDGAASREALELPAPDVNVLPGVLWGRHDCLFTPAYWAAQVWHHTTELAAAPLRMGETLVEEVAACLLGGYGAPSEIGLAAFRAVRESGLLNGSPPTCAAVEAILSAPLAVGDRRVHYRFWRQRSRYLTDAVVALKRSRPPEHSHIQFRDCLTAIDGIGLKTASWITRNWLDSDQVAVLDVHVVRAGCIVGLFGPQANVSRDYRSLEEKFLTFARAISVRASRLDALIWRQMKSAGQIGLRLQSLVLQPQPVSNTLPYAA